MKIVKKLLAGVAMLTALVSVGGVSVAHAGTDMVPYGLYCPPHGPYGNKVISVTQLSYEVHYVELPPQYAYDDLGERVEVFDGNGNRFTTSCVVHTYGYQIGVYCTWCGWVANQYFYVDGPIHSYCGRG